MHGPKHFVFICFFLSIESFSGHKHEYSQMEMKVELRKMMITDVLHSVPEKYLLLISVESIKTSHWSSDLGQRETERKHFLTS